jgi:excisionase family DNA binding protein
MRFRGRRRGQDSVEPEELLTVAETARLLSRSTEQVRRYLREGVLPGRRLGGQWFIARPDAETLLTRRASGDDFHRRLAASDADPLGMTIGLGASGGASIAVGRANYLRALPGASRG